MTKWKFCWSNSITLAWTLIPQRWHAHSSQSDCSFFDVRLLTTVTSERSMLTQVGLPYKNDRSARRRISKKPLKGTKIVFNERGPDSFWCTNNSKYISYLRKCTHGLVIFQNDNLKFPLTAATLAAVVNDKNQEPMGSCKKLKAAEYQFSLQQVETWFKIYMAVSRKSEWILLIFFVLSILSCLNQTGNEFFSGHIFTTA